MKKYLLIPFIFSVFFAGAQNGYIDSTCLAQFKYEFNFNAMRMSALPLTAVDFYDVSDGDAVSWLWDFGDGTKSREQNPSHMYDLSITSDDGMINPFRIVSLSVVTSDSCKSIYSDTINIMVEIPDEPYCDAGFRYYVADYDSAVGTASVQFKNISQGDSLKYFWQFDNDRTSNEREPLVLFDIGQEAINVCLTVDGADECTNTFCQDVYIKNVTDTFIYPERCQARFNYEINNMIMSPLPVTAVNFYDISEGNIVSWLWDFGDGNKSREQNPFHIYDRPVQQPNVKINPYRLVKLTILTSDSCRSSYWDTINIMRGVPINELYCNAGFRYYIADYDSIERTTSVQFRNISEGDSLNYFWQFDSTRTSSEREPLVEFDSSRNFYNVCLTVEGANDCLDTFCQDVYIKMPGDTIINPDCQTHFRYEINHEIMTFAPALALNFYSRSAPEAVEWFWDFGDGNTSNVQNPIHIFNFPQTIDSVLGDPNPFRTICLKVVTENGCVARYCETINIYMTDSTIVESEECQTHFNYAINHDIQTFAPALVLDFYPRTIPEAVEWNWDFGDGSTSSEKTPFHIFNYPVDVDSVLGDPNPFREVCLTATTAEGCVARYCETINIYMSDSSNVDPERCQARFKYYQLTELITIPEVVPYQFIDASEGEVISRLWQFEDGTSSTEAEPQVNFDIFKPTQKVCLTITAADSCSSTWCEYISVRKEIPDSANIPGSDSIYVMRYESSFPIYMSSCAGWVKAQVYLGDSVINATDYKWSHGVEGQEANGFCPTRTYSVKAIAPDGTIVSGTFVFNADGTVTLTPIDWWVSGDATNPVIQYRSNNTNYYVEWKLCDGTTIKADSISFDLINCDDQESNLIIKDSLGNVVYAESISQKSVTTFINAVQNTRQIKLFPNPVNDVLNIQYSGGRLDDLTIEICDFSGRRILNQNFRNLESGQNIGLNVHTLDNGLYFCRMISGKQLIGVEKFTK